MEGQKRKVGQTREDVLEEGTLKMGRVLLVVMGGRTERVVGKASIEV